MRIFLGKKGMWMSLRRADDGEYAGEYSFMISTECHGIGAAEATHYIRLECF